jgi:tetratricopeptide (TPR) repeat protein
MKKCSPLVLLFVAVIGLRQLPAANDVLLPTRDAPAAVAAANKANDLAKKGDYNGAIGYFGAAIKMEPHMYLAYFGRGQAYMHQHKYQAAIADFNSALRISPGFFLAGIDRAEANESLGHYEQALAELNHIISLQPLPNTRARTLTVRAWLFATCPNPHFRNGKQAVSDAMAACRIDSWDNWDYIDTLAAAYAEAGDFENAMKFEKKAIRKARDAEDKKGAQERLTLYQQHHPFHLSAR